MGLNTMPNVVKLILATKSKPKRKEFVEHTKEK